MALITASDIVASGIVPSYAAVNSEDTLKINDQGRTFLHVKNGGGGSINVTLVARKTSAKVPGAGTVTISNRVVAVGNGAEKMIGPLEPAFADADGIVTIQYSGTSSVTAAAFNLPRS